MEFLDAVDNVQREKKIPPRGEVGKMVWGVKRFMSMHPTLTLAVNFLDKYHFTLGDDRFYELMVYAMPAGRFRTKSVKKEDLEAISLAPGTDLERRVREYFGVWGRESISTLLEILKNQGLGIDDLKRHFGVNTGKVKISAPARHNPPKGADRSSPKKVRTTRGFQGVQRQRASEAC